MIRLVSRGRFTHQYLKGLLGAPEDREPAVRKVVEAAGGKVISFYLTTGDTDFLLISEANEAESVIASLMAASATGTISNVSTVRAWTGAEFKEIAERAAKASSAYRPPGAR
ncbi:MAG: GYD domain-containing protein [Rhizobiales bacterium]|nr:GYD domain-containing protein [Hyphomicrobiales bacterium]